MCFGLQFWPPSTGVPVFYYADTVATPCFLYTHDEIIRDLNSEVKSACPAYTKNYLLPTTNKSAVLLGAPVLARQGALVTRGMRPPYKKTHGQN